MVTKYNKNFIYTFMCRNKCFYIMWEKSVIIIIIIIIITIIITSIIVRVRKPVTVAIRSFNTAFSVLGFVSRSKVMVIEKISIWQNIKENSI